VIPVLSREQIREFDRHAIESCRVPSVVLMENAGRNAAAVVLEHASGKTPSRVLVVAGLGNNGGDGFVVARHALVAGASVEVWLAGDPERLRGDAKANHDAWSGLGGRVSRVEDAAGVDALAAALAQLASEDVIVDALLGTGLDRPVEGLLADVISAVNAARAEIVSLDVPSGLDANTGAALGVCVRAKKTVTFAHPKLGLLTPVGSALAGELRVVDIGVPGELEREVGASAYCVDGADVAGWLTPRSRAAHKGNAGHVFALAGSPGKTGAALLVARGALRAGAGLATLCTFADAAAAIDRRVLEEMTARIDPDAIEASLDAQLERADVLVLGPGFGTDDRAKRAIDHVVQTFDGPIVLDADALTLHVGRLGELKSAKGALILTPHPAELGRLLGTSAAEVEQDRFSAVVRAASESGAVVLLKGVYTLVAAPGEPVWVNTTGTPALATAGAGDVLSGVIAALAVSLPARRAASAGAHVHGLAAERWSRASGSDRGLLAHEVADQIPHALAALG